MTDPGPFRMSQGYDVLQPKTGRAYPVPCDEWEFLKDRLRRVSVSPWFYQTAGPLLAGVGITTFVTILVGTLPPISQSRAIAVAWAVVAVSLICAAACFHVASQQRKMQSVEVSDVVTHMELIERRYERSDAGVGQASSQSVLKIVSARYGAAKTYQDVGTVLAELVDASGLRVIVENGLFGDPCPGIQKELIVEYEYKGQRCTKTAREHHRLSIP